MNVPPGVSLIAQLRFHAGAILLDMTSPPARVSLTGIVKTTAPSQDPTQPGTATISIPAADPAYREILENTLTNKNGDGYTLKAGAEVLVTIKTEEPMRPLY